MTVVRDSKVVEMAAYLASYRLPKVGECAGATFSAKPVVDFHQSPAQALFRRLTFQPCFTRSTPAPVVGEAKVVKRRRTLSRLEHLPRLSFAKGDQTSFRHVETKTEFPQPLGKHPHKAVGIILSLEHCKTSSAYRVSVQ